MNVLFEEDGGFKAGSVMADNDSSLQVEMPTGKRSKIKAATVLLRFEKPSAAALLDQATPLAEEIEAEFLWECVNDGEFSFLDFAALATGHFDLQRTVVVGHDAAGLKAAIFFK